MSRQYLALASAVLAFCIFSTSARAQVVGCPSGFNCFYVGNFGNGAPSDSNNGTSNSTPWATLTHAIAAFTMGTNGTVIHVADGSYANLNFNRGGTSSTVHVTLECDNGIASGLAAQGHCLISGANEGILVTSGANNITIVGFDIGNNGNMDSAIDVQDDGTRPVSGTGNSTYTIGNYIHDLGATSNAGCPLSGAILYQYKVTDARIIGNAIFRFGTVPAGGGGVSGCNTAHGMYIDTDGATIENNISVQAPASNLQVFHFSCNEKISNNVFISANAGILFTGTPTTAECPNGGVGLSTIENNIFENHTGGHIWLKSPGSECPGGQVLASHNISDGISDFNQSTLDACVSSVGWIHEVTSKTFVSYSTTAAAGFDYHLTSGSGGVLGGATQCATSQSTPCTPSTDFTGLTRPTPPSVGVYETAPMIVCVNQNAAAGGAVTFDSVATAQSGAGVGSLSWSHTVGSGANRLLTVGVVSACTPTASFAGVNMTLFGSAPIGSNPSTAQAYLFYAANPASGAGTVAVAFTGCTSDSEADSISFSGVNTTTPLAHLNTNFGNSAAPTVNITSAPGDLVVDVLGAGSPITSSNQTQRWKVNLNSNSNHGNGAQSTAAGAASVTMSYVTTADQWGILGADIQAAPGNSSSVAVTYPSAQTAANMNTVAISTNDTTSVVSSVTDSNHNGYLLAVGPTRGTGISEWTYYAPNIVGSGPNTNVVTTTFSGTATLPSETVCEYNFVNQLDQTAAASGTSTAANSGNATTLIPTELLFGAGTTSATFSGGGSGFIQRTNTSFGDLAEDRNVTTTGTYNATATLGASNPWIMQMSTFSQAKGGQPSPPQGLFLGSGGGLAAGPGSGVSGWLSPVSLNPTLPQRWVNGREALLGSYTNTIALPASGSGGSWSCHGSARGPYTMPTLAGLNAAISDAELCRANNGDSTKITIPPTTVIDASFNGGGNNFVNLIQSTSPLDNSTSPIVIDSTSPLPTTDPGTGLPRDQRFGTYNIASTNGLVRTSNVVTVTTMTAMPVAPTAGDLATIWLPDDKSFQGQYTICTTPVTGCIVPTTTQFTYQQTGANATTQNGMVFSLQAQNTISAIAVSGCSTSGANCTLTIDFTANPNFNVNDRFDIVNSTCTNCISLDPQSFNTTWYVATVSSNGSCGTCRITVNSYTEFFSNSATASNGTALHANHIKTDQLTCCMYTIENTTGSGDMVFGGQNNYHNYLIADAELRSQLGNVAGMPVVVAFEPNAYVQQTPIPPTTVTGCNGSPGVANCDEPVHVGIDRSYIHAYAFPVVGRAVNNITVGIQLDCGFCYITNSYLENIHVDGAESHAIHVKSGTGPFKIVNNYIEGSSENLFASYTPHPTGLPNGYYCDWEIRRNWFSKNMFESLNSGHSIPDGSGQYFQYLMKNNFEFKNVCNALVDGNIFEKSAGGIGEQQGVLMGNNSTGDNQTGNPFLPGAQSHDVTYSNNIYRHAMGISYIPSKAISGDGETMSTLHYAWLNNLGYDLGNITLYGRNGWTGSNWNFAFSAMLQIANRGDIFNCSGTSTQSNGNTTITQTCTPQNALCVGPNSPATAPAPPCGVGFQAGDWVSVHSCSDTNYNVTAPVQVPATSTDATLTATTFTYVISGTAAGASATGCVAANAYGFPRYVTFAHNTIVQNFNFANPTFGNLYFGKAHIFGWEGIMGGDSGALVMVRNWHIQNNVFSLQLGPSPSPQYFWCAPNGKDGTTSEQTCIDSNSFVWIKNAITGFTPANFTEYNNPFNQGRNNNGVSPPVTDFMGLTSACSGAPNNTCIGFQGNYANNSCGVLGCGVGSNVPDFAPSTQDYHLFGLQSGPSGSFFAAGNAGQASDNTDTGVNLPALDSALTRQTYVCASQCGTPFP